MPTVSRAGHDFPLRERNSPLADRKTEENNSADSLLAVFEMNVVYGMGSSFSNNIS
jgi:hypothetical protein